MTFYIGQRYGLEVWVKQPKEMNQEAKYREIKVDKWQICVTTSPERKDLPRQKIKIELSNVPAYSRTPQMLRQNYDFLPDGYSDMLIMAESLNEIMADKLVSLVNCRSYIRHRDIWDLRWLKQQAAVVHLEYIQAKIDDYRITDYQPRLDEMIAQLNEIITSKAFNDEMSRFIPIDVQKRTLQKENFIKFLGGEVTALLLEVRNKLYPE